MPAYMSFETVAYLTPEIILLGVATLIYVLGAFWPSRGVWGVAAVGSLLAAGFAITQFPGDEIARGPIAGDAFGDFVRFLSLAVGVLFVLAAGREGSRLQGTEYIGSILLAIAGLMLVGSANELVLVFLGLELISMPTYLLLYLGRRDGASQESALKYFFLNILSSSVMLYGFSFIYGVAGSTDLAEIRSALADGRIDMESWQPFLALGLVLVFAGLGFKVAAAPFHFYAPDVYQGTTNANAGLLSVLPKVAGFVVLVRVLLIALPGSEPFGWRVALILAVLTMTLGNIVALWQTNLRRLLAYSSIAHTGYILIGLAVAFAARRGAEVGEGFDGVAAMLLYMAVYAVATVGTFAAFTYLGSDEREMNTLDDLAGLASYQPIVALMIAVFMFSLAGIPPLAGFWGKFALFGSALTIDAGPTANTESGAALGTWFVWLAVIGVLNAAIAAAYYLRIIGVMYFGEAKREPEAEGGQGAWLAAAVAAVVVVVAVGFIGPIWNSAIVASQSLSAPQQPAQAAAVESDGENLAAQR